MQDFVIIFIFENEKYLFSNIQGLMSITLLQEITFITLLQKIIRLLQKI